MHPISSDQLSPRPARANDHAAFGRLHASILAAVMLAPALFLVAGVLVAVGRWLSRL